MDLPKRLAPQGSRSPGRNHREMEPRAAAEADENAATPRRPAPARSASPQRKKVLGERNSGGSGSRSRGSAQHKAAAASPPSPKTAGPYDPKTNCTTPRPEFLRYDPKRSAEILLRLEREAAEEGELSGVTSGTDAVSSDSGSDPKRSAEILLRLEREAAEEGELSGVTSGTDAVSSDSGSDRDDADEEDEVLQARQGGGWAWRLFLLLVAAACLLCYMNCMSPATFPATIYSDEPLDLVGWNGSVRDVGAHQVFSLGPVDMMGLEDGPGADMGRQSVYRGSGDGTLLRGPGGSPSKFMAVAMMGMADACPNVPFGEFSCQIGDENSEDVDVLKQGSEIGELESEAMIGSVHQEKEEDNSEHSMEKTMGSEGVVEVEGDDEELPSLEYGNTAEAAKKLVHVVKKFRSAVEPHLLKMLACLSAAGFVTAMLLYSRRSRSVNVPRSKRVPSAPPAQASILAPHNIAQPVFHSAEHVHRTMPKQEPSSCLELPVQSFLPKPDTSVSLDVPSVGLRNHDQKIQQGDAGIARASDLMDRKDTDKSKPPVVQLLGEFSYVDTGSSRRRSAIDSDKHGGDMTVQDSVSAGKDKDVAKMQKKSDRIQSPGVQAARKKESATEEKTDATPTPLRRSSRLHKKTSP